MNMELRGSTKDAEIENVLLRAFSFAPKRRVVAVKAPKERGRGKDSKENTRIRACERKFHLRGPSKLSSLPVDAEGCMDRRAGVWTHVHVSTGSRERDRSEESQLTDYLRASPLSEKMLRRLLTLPGPPGGAKPPPPPPPL